MDAEARKALTVIRDAVAKRRFRVLTHFAERMDERGFFWGDVRAILRKPSDVRSDGRDRYGRPKWIVSGTARKEFPMDVVCVLDADDRGRVVVFITVY